MCLNGILPSSVYMCGATERLRCISSFVHKFPLRILYTYLFLIIFTLHQVHKVLKEYTCKLTLFLHDVVH